MVNSEEKEVLLSLVQGPNGGPWPSSASRVGWSSNSAEEVCEWDGIECDTHDTIIALLLASSSLSASLPSQLGSITSLRKIQLEINHISGSIPEELASLPYLEVLNLSTNHITGTLPESFASSILQILALRSNSINGSIPTELVTTPSCKEISLSKNILSGTIPPSFYELSILDTLDLSSNSISGTISEDIGSLLFLQNLRLDNNTLIGPIPPSLAVANPLRNNVGNLLQDIWLNDNQLSGTIPIQLADLANLRSLLLHNNKLTGEIPPDLCSEFINPNFFRSTPLDHDRNYCDAIACEPHETALKGSYPCTPCLPKHFNPYIGQWGSCVTDVNQRAIMKTFYRKTSLAGAWTDGKDGTPGDNWLDNLTFICDFTGVTCDQNYHVVAINLSNRGLHGTLSPEIGFLPYLEVLDVSDNVLYGFLPSDLRWAPLTTLDISGNRIRGVVPPMLCSKGQLNSDGVVGWGNDCYHVACPAGLYSPSGRRSIMRDEDCQPCHHMIPPYLGFKGCKRSGAPGNYPGFGFQGESSTEFGVFIVLFTLIIAIGFFVVVYRYFRRNMKARLHREQGGIAMYDFGNNKDQSTMLERDNMMDAYVASAGRSSAQVTFASQYSDLPHPQTMAGSLTMKTSAQVNKRTSDGSASVSSNGSVGSTRSVGSRSVGSTSTPRSAKSRTRKKAIRRRSEDNSQAKQEVRQPVQIQNNASGNSKNRSDTQENKAAGNSKHRSDKQDQKSTNSDNSNKGDAKVWLDVPIV